MIAYRPFFEVFFGDARAHAAVGPSILATRLERLLGQQSRRWKLGPVLVVRQGWQFQIRRVLEPPLLARAPVQEFIDRKACWISVEYHQPRRST